MTDLPVSGLSGGDGVLPVAAHPRPAAEEKRRVTPPGAEDVPFTGALLWGVGFLLATANFFAVLDTAITNVSVPNIAGGLAVSPSEGTWTITSYSVAEAITVPLTGWLARRFGTVTVFCTAMSLFGLFSFLCGFAPSLGLLVTFRVCQGLAGGPMIPLSQTLLLRVFPKRLAPQAIALWGMTTVVAPIAGPLLGGALCDTVGWPWIFYINVPFALVVAFFAWRLLKPKETAGAPAKIDAVGLGLLVLWITAMQIMLDKGKELDWFASPFIVALAVIAGVGFCAFLIWELTDKNPVVDLRVFRHRSFATACTVMALAYGGFFASNVLLPLWLQTNLGYTATWAGRATAWSGVLALVFSPIVGRLISGGRIDPRMLVTLGIAWSGCMMAWRAHFNTDVNFDRLIWPQLLQGMSMPFFFIPLMTLGTASLPPEETATGASLISFVRTTAGAIAVSLTTTAWEDGGDTARVQILNQAGGLDAAMGKLQAMGFSAAQAARQVEGVVQGQAVMVATDRMFLLVAVLLFAASLSIWIAPRPQAGAKAAPGAH